MPTTGQNGAGCWPPVSALPEGQPAGFRGTCRKASWRKHVPWEPESMWVSSEPSGCQGSGDTTQGSAPRWAPTARLVPVERFAPAMNERMSPQWLRSDRKKSRVGCGPDPEESGWTSQSPPDQGAALDSGVRTVSQSSPRRVTDGALRGPAAAAGAARSHVPHDPGKPMPRPHGA